MALVPVASDAVNDLKNPVLAIPFRPESIQHDVATGVLPYAAGNVELGDVLRLGFLAQDRLRPLERRPLGRGVVVV